MIMKVACDQMIVRETTPPYYDGKSFDLEFHIKRSISHSATLKAYNEDKLKEFVDKQIEDFIVELERDWLK